MIEHPVRRTVRRDRSCADAAAWSGVSVDSRPEWNDWFLGIAEAVSRRGDCRRSQVGAVLVRPDRTICSVGFNGMEPGKMGCLAGGCPRGLMSYDDVAPASSYDSGPPESRCDALHAEMNCLAFSREDTTGFTLYVTREPCIGCGKTIRAHRLAAVVWPGCGQEESL